MIGSSNLIYTKHTQVCRVHPKLFRPCEQKSGGGENVQEHRDRARGMYGSIDGNFVFCLEIFIDIIGEKYQQTTARRKKNAKGKYILSTIIHDEF